MLFDTHSHCYLDILLPHIDDILSHMREHHISHAVQIGCDLESSKKAIHLAEKYPNTFMATVGYHPEEAQDDKDFSHIELLEQLVIDNRKYIVAIGETGLDYHYLDGSDGGKNIVDMHHLSEKAISQIAHQKTWWMMQWELAVRQSLPLIIHTRDARDATLDFMLEEGISRAVMHCFSEDWDFAKTLLDFSSEIYFSFSGILTYKNALKIQEAAAKIPLNRILIETDSPFLAPVPVRGTQNEPANTRYILDKLTLLRDEPRDTIEAQVYENSLRFYNMDDSRVLQ